MTSLRTADLTNKKVFLRADLNVPLIDGAIVDDFRLIALMPTLDLLINKQAKIILATHIGRPKGIPEKNPAVKLCHKKRRRFQGKCPTNL